ncbi:MAG TPA: Zn-dependent alcohol dehydrogenase [Myxococcales bacterium]|nr:Zn-dependent alcohol dehydrogenase [Myxococcales bacterium]
MKAAICHEFDKPVRVEEVTLDGPRRNEVRVRIAACGVCHSDLSVIRGILRSKLPCVLGHEGAGIVEDVGEGVTHVAPGDKVVLAWVMSCSTCFYCRIGKPQLCELGERINKTNRMPDGSTRVHQGKDDLWVFSAVGALAEEVVVPASAAVKLPADAPLEKCALLGCAVLTGVGAVFNTAQVTPGSSVVVFGAGGVGLNAIQGAAIAGAERIIAVDAQPAKLELARRFGATDVIDATKTDAVEAVRALTEGRGADYGFEAIGRTKTVEQAWASVRKAGTCVAIGIGSMKESVSINALMLPMLEKRLLGCWYGSANVHVEVPRLLALYRRGKLKLDELVTRTYPLSAVNEAFADMSSGANARGVVTF